MLPNDKLKLGLNCSKEINFHNLFTLSTPSNALLILMFITTWKISVFGVFLDRCGAYQVSLRVQSESGKIRTRKTTNMDTFLAVYVILIFCNVNSLVSKVFYKSFCSPFMERMGSGFFVLWHQFCLERFAFRSVSLANFSKLLSRIVA